MEVRKIPPRLNRVRKPSPVASVEEKPIAPALPAQPRITKIKAAPKTETKKLRVAGYCRVSTGSIDQASSILNQREHYEAYIKANPDWECVGIYWEADVSGTKASNRSELQRLISDCKAGRVDLILTKSISRFARSTTDCLEMVRTLTALGVNIRFEKEGINTGSMESEFLLTLFSSFAEEESKSISLNETWAKRKQFQNGTFRFSIAPFGYDLVDSSFIINTEQAPIVKEIFNAALSGKGTTKIARELNARGIPTGTKRNDGSPGVWTAYMVNGIIKNVVYLGDVLHQKTFNDHFHVKYNYGERQQYYNEGHHAAIIDKETFDAANAALRQRGAEKGNVPKDRHLRNNPHNNRYAFSGRLTCACCGGKMKRVTQKTTQGMRYHWSCAQHLADKEACTMKREQEESIRNAFSTMMNKLVFSHSLILDTFLEGEKEDSTKAAELNKIQDEKRRLTLLLTKGCGESALYYQKIMQLECQENELRASPTSDRVLRIKELKAVLNDWKKGGDPDTFFTKVCDGAAVKTGEYAEFNLKCGLKLRESLKGEQHDTIRL